MSATERRASILLRVDASLKEKLYAQAHKNERTIRAEASRILRKGLERNLKPHLVQTQP